MLSASRKAGKVCVLFVQDGSQGSEREKSTRLSRKIEPQLNLEESLGGCKHAWQHTQVLKVLKRIGSTDQLVFEEYGRELYRMSRSEEGRAEGVRRQRLTVR